MKKTFNNTILILFDLKFFYIFSMFHNYIDYWIDLNVNWMSNDVIYYLLYKKNNISEYSMYIKYHLYLNI